MRHLNASYRCLSKQLTTQPICFETAHIHTQFEKDFPELQVDLSEGRGGNDVTFTVKLGFWGGETSEKTSTGERNWFISSSAQGGKWIVFRKGFTGSVQVCRRIQVSDLTSLNCSLYLFFLVFIIIIKGTAHL